MTISVIGAGGWGTALALQAAKKSDTILWSYSEDEARLFDDKRENTYYLPGVSIPNEITITADIEIAAKSDVWLFVPPSKYFRAMVKLFAPFATPDKIIVSATKGFEFPSELRMSRILCDELSACRGPIVLSGPTHAEEVARDVPSSIVAASKDNKTAKIIQELFANDSFRVYTNNDIIGVEVSAAVKNAIAVAAGMLRGLGFGDNTMATLITRGLAEITRLGLKLGATEATFAGLAGVGDLMVTCISKHSRNGKVGEGLAAGKTIDDILGNTKMVAEGVETVKTLVRFETELGIELPISHAVYDVIYNHIAPITALKNLMKRPLKNERD